MIIKGFVKVVDKQELNKAESLGLDTDNLASERVSPISLRGDCIEGINPNTISFCGKDIQCVDVYTVGGEHHIVLAEFNELHDFWVEILHGSKRHVYEVGCTTETPVRSGY